MRGGELWVFFRKSSGFGLEKALAVMTGEGYPPGPIVNGVAGVDIRGRVFRFSECSEEEAIELRDVAASKIEGPPRHALAACDAAVQVEFDDLDSALDEINAIIEIQMALQDATKGFLFLGWNGNVDVPE